jgi:arylsulfatase A-like enzyme
MANQPNIVYIMTDQQRADCSAREGFPLDTTPFLDALARKGKWFDHAYAAAPVCGPSRVSMLTGRFPSTHRVRENAGIGYATFEKDIVDVMNENGYATALVGKNHSHLKKEKLDHMFLLTHAAGYGTDDPRTDEEMAFDQWIKELNNGTGMEATPFPLECQGPYRAVTDAEQWIQSVKEQDSDKPFFLWLSFAEPHNPYQVPEPYFSKFPIEKLPPLATSKADLEGKSFKWKFTRALGEYYHPDYEEQIPRTRANYYGLMNMIDDQVRRFVEFLEAKSLSDNTIIIFSSDHGDFAGEYGLVRKGPEVPEVIMRVPMFIMGPGIQAGQDPHPAHVSLVDVMPTLCEAAGIPIPRGVQGRSLWPLLTGEEYPQEEFASVYAEQGFGGLHYTEHDEIDYGHCASPGLVRDTFDSLNTYSQSGTLRMVRKGDWKLAYDMQGAGQLYDLSLDPLELHNVYGTPDALQAQAAMLAELATWMLRMQDPLPYPKGKYRIKTDSQNYWTQRPNH